MTEPLTVAEVKTEKLRNAKHHNTDRFEELYKDNTDSLIIRRGQAFRISVTFAQRSFNEDTDSLKFIFKFGPKSDSTKYTKSVVSLKPKGSTVHNERHWNAVIVDIISNEVIVEVFSPFDCPVGEWFLDIETDIIPSNSKSLYNLYTPIYILFNPWNKDDAVYMSDPRLLDEYILNDSGKIWVGVIGSIKGREWSFGQFNENVLKSTIFMLNKSGLPHHHWGDPIKMARCISKMVNENDDEGVLIGRWDGDYVDGTTPSYWIGSADILTQYLLTGRPVKYGQCWIFAAVVTTICRALGIPSRVVSNMVSAQNISSMVINRYYDKKYPYKMQNYNESDSIWNYHVWNDVWMIRSDLPSGYSGWQAIDATPKSKSDNMFQCGPAPLEAIRRGQVGLQYDVDVLLSAVNAKILRWKLDSQSEDDFIDRIGANYRIGRLILTKKPWLFDPNGDRDREDVTLEYKGDYSIADETPCLLRQSSTSGDVEFCLEDIVAVRIGTDFRTSVAIGNKSTSERNIHLWMDITSRFYNGVEANLIENVEKSLFLQPGSSLTVDVDVKSDSYIDKLVEYGIMKVKVAANVIETGQVWLEEDDLQVVKPTIIFKIPLAIPHKKPTKIHMYFTNPLKKALTNCKFAISGSFMSSGQMMMYQDVKPLGVIKAECTITPQVYGNFVGKHKIMASFVSDQLQDITGSAEVTVFETEE